MNQRDLNIERRIDAYLDRVRSKVDEAIEPALANARADFLVFLEDKIRSMFNEVVQDFYASYPPVFYDRNESLYNILQTKVTDESLRLWFEPEEMTPFRSGYTGEDGLYDQVFRRGWHGGAGSGEGHPPGGDPYWRTPVPYYSHWGKKAKISDPSPLEDIKRRIADYQEFEIKADLKSIVLAHISTIKIDM